MQCVKNATCYVCSLMSQIVTPATHHNYRISSCVALISASLHSRNFGVSFICPLIVNLKIQLAIKISEGFLEPSFPLNFHGFPRPESATSYVKDFTLPIWPPFLQVFLIWTEGGGSWEEWDRIVQCKHKLIKDVLSSLFKKWGGDWAEMTEAKPRAFNFLLWNKHFLNLFFSIT